MIFNLLLVLVLFNVVNGQIGDSCDFSNGQSGECIPFRDCQSAIDLVKKKGRPQPCGFDGNHPLVCCPKPLARLKCKQYAKELKRLVVHSAVGGTDAVLQEYPHMTALGYGNPDNTQWLCGGSLITKTHILTAAHCLNAGEIGPVKYARLGIVRLNDTADVQNFEIASRIGHPEYRSPSTYNDIAILELDKPVEYTIFVKPACLYAEPFIPEGKLWTLTATGWGLTQFGGSVANVLQKVKLQLFTYEECSRTYQATSKRRLKNGIMEDSQICAGGKNEEKDTCQGDSGGPLQLYRFEGSTGIGDIVGVTSFGKSCGVANVPGVYTKVSHFVPWIENIVWPEGK